MTAELADFLLARIAEDRAVAQAAIDWQGEGALPWVANGGGVDQADGHGIAGYAGDDVAPHIVRWDPARVLAECDAKRRIVEYAARGDGDWAAGSPMVGYRSAMRDVLRALALPYANHPDYREEWRP